LTSGASLMDVAGENKNAATGTAWPIPSRASLAGMTEKEKICHS